MSKVDWQLDKKVIYTAVNCEKFAFTDKKKLFYKICNKLINLIKQHPTSEVSIQFEYKKVSFISLITKETYFIINQELTDEEVN